MLDYPYNAKDRVEPLIATLERLIKRDPDREVSGIPIPVFDACVEAIKEHQSVRAVSGSLSGVSRGAF